MSEPDEVSSQELRKAMLNIADAVRVIAIGMDRLALRLAISRPLQEIDPSMWMEMNHIREATEMINNRLSAAVDLLVKENDERST